MTSSRRRKGKKDSVGCFSAVEDNRAFSIGKAARLYRVPITALRSRFKGPAHHNRKGVQHCKLHQDEENSLAQSVLSLIQQEAAPSLVQIREMANLLLTKRHTQPTSGVAPDWASRFINRREELKKVYPTPMPPRDDCQRDESEDVSAASEWFDLVQTTVMQHEIAKEDIYHFEETGYAIGLLASAQVVTKSEMIERASLAQPDNRRWATLIECINSTGVAMPPCIVFKGRYHLEYWYQVQGLPGDWRIDVSPNGWATDMVRLSWLKDLFVPATSRTVGRFRLLILDQSNYLTPQFAQICKDNNIIPICPPSNSRIWLPLEAGCLSSLEDAYRGQAENFMRHGCKYIDKVDFLASLPELRRQVYTAENIKNGFSAAGIIPLCREKLLLRPETRLRDRTPVAIGPTAADILRENRLGKELSLLKPQLRADAEALGLSSYNKAAMEWLFRQCGKIDRYICDMQKEYDELQASIEENEERVQAEEEAEEAYQGE